jgi:sphingosine kinase
MCPVPTGSGNGMAASCGLWDPATAAVAVCRGRVHACDVISALQPPGTRLYCLLSLVYGLMANLDINTEHLRWAGRRAGRWVQAGLQ